jgi:hypothetical protein
VPVLACKVWDLRLQRQIPAAEQREKQTSAEFRSAALEEDAHIAAVLTGYSVIEDRLGSGYHLVWHVGRIGVLVAATGGH